MWGLYARAVAAVLVLVLSGLGAGRWVRRFLPAEFSPLESLAFECLGGLGFLSTILFLLGQISFSPVAILSVVSLTALLGLHYLLTLPRINRPVLAGFFRPPPFATLTIALVLLITAIAGLAEITGDWGHDGIAYHLHGPKVWLRDGIIRPVPDTSNSAFPATNEVLFAALMTIGGERAPGFSALMTLVLFLAVVSSLARRVGLSVAGTWWVIALVSAMPAVYSGLHSGFVDVFYSALVLAAMRVGLDSRSPRDFVGFGLFCGLAMASKYTGLVALPILLLCSGLSAGTLGKSEWKATSRNILIGATMACVLASPYYIRNWILFGFPIFPPPPFAVRFLRSDYFLPGGLSEYYAAFYKHGAGLGESLGAFLLLPFNLTYHTANFNGAGGIGLAGLALGPIGLYAAWRLSVSRALALLAFLLAIFWFFTLQESRYLISVYAICAIFGVLGWDYVRALNAPRSRVLAALAVLCSLVYGLFMIASARVQDLRSALSLSFAEEHREHSIPFLAGFQYLNNDPSLQKVLILDRSVPPYYLNKSYVKPFGQWGERTVPGVTSVSQALAIAPGLGVTHILDVESEIAGFQVSPHDPRFVLVFSSLHVRIYRSQ